MFEITSGYSTLENDFFLHDRRLLVELEFEVINSRLKIEGLVI